MIRLFVGVVAVAALASKELGRRTPSSSRSAISIVYVVKTPLSWRTKRRQRWRGGAHFAIEDEQQHGRISATRLQPRRRQAQGPTTIRLKAAICAGDRTSPSSSPICTRARRKARGRDPDRGTVLLHCRAVD